MSETENVLREQVVHYAKRLTTERLTPGKSGNISVRSGTDCMITPSAIEYEALSVDDIVLIDLYGNIIQGNHQPSSEWSFHCGMYKSRVDINAVVHTHSTYCTALACAHEKIPAFHYMVAIAGGSDIPLIPYHLFGSEELSMAVVSGLKERDACLMENHGLVSVGKSLQSAFALAEEVEQLAKQYCKDKTIGDPQRLTEMEMHLVIEKFKDYGDRS